MKRAAPDEYFGGLFGTAPTPGPGVDVQHCSAASPASLFPPDSLPAAAVPVDVSDPEHVAAPDLGVEAVVDGKLRLTEGVEYRTLYLWQMAYDKLVQNHAICQDFSPAYMGDLLVLLGDEPAYPGRGHYVLLAELVAVRDECAGERKRFIWKFENLRDVHRRPGERQGGIGRITFQPAAMPPQPNGGHDGRA